MKRAELILLSITAIWGSTFPVMKVSLNGVSPVLLLAYRFGIASAVMLLLFGRRALKRDTLKAGFLLGITLFLGNAFQIVGLEYTTPTNSGFITALYVVFTPFIAYFLLGDEIRRDDVMSLLLVIPGLYLISGATLHIDYGDALTVLCAISFAFQIVLVHKYSGLDYLSLSFWQIFWNFVFSTVYSVLFEGLEIPKGTTTWFGIIYLAIFATVLTFTLQVKYQGETRAQRAAMIYSAEPLFSYFTSFLFLGEVLNMKGNLGGLLILAGIWNEVRKG
ncbi:DMT family transporter [Thermococcus sp. Bubb.Bath]|uniref:DMT family transporter n=1 Tax=Thermococcus sp. Bubb.Bath TaxID=1638242 RepID=UPI00143A9DFD|nr:DMT family transporter [Thermococcus sp. Bubb.Bath]NJF25415.1 DMT family transporter [Thermococcus sp. Bubb.Bath]